MAEPVPPEDYDDYAEDEVTLESMGFTSFGKKAMPPKYLQQQAKKNDEASTSSNAIPLGVRGQSQPEAASHDTVTPSPNVPFLPAKPVPVSNDVPMNDFSASYSHQGEPHQYRGRGRGGQRSSRGRGGRGGRGGGSGNHGTPYHPYSRPNQGDATSDTETGMSEAGFERAQHQNHYVDEVFGPGYYKPSFIEDPWRNLG